METAERVIGPRPSCFVCGGTGSLILCSKCRVVHYCGREHQRRDWGKHKITCRRIGKKYDLQDQTRRSAWIDWIAAMAPDDQKGSRLDILDPCKPADWDMLWSWGPFKNYFQGQDYLMQIHAHLGYRLATIPTRAALELALHHLTQCTRYSTLGGEVLDNILDHIPFIYLRLGREQESIDLVRSLPGLGYLTTRWGSRYRPPGTNGKLRSWLTKGCKGTPGLMIPRESSHWADRYQLGALVCWMLHHVKSLFSLRDAKHVRLLRGKLPPEVIHQVQLEIATPPTRCIQEFVKDIRQGQDLAPWILRVEESIECLFYLINRKHTLFWAIFLDPNYHLNSDYGPFYPPKFGRILIASQASDAFAETPGALDWLTDNHIKNLVPHREAESLRENVAASNMTTTDFRKHLSNLIFSRTLNWSRPTHNSPSTADYLHGFPP